MKYPIQIVELNADLSLYIPVPEKIKKIYNQLISIDANSPFPFWAKLWASSKALSKFLVSNPYLIKDKIVLEIGAGIGQPCFTIVGIAKKVIISDYNYDALSLIRKNIVNLGLTNAQGILLDWNEFDYSIQADVILLSDINYAPCDFKPLLQVIEHYISTNAVIIIATPQRIMGMPFIDSLQAFIKHSYVESILDQESVVMIRLYVLYK